ATIPHVKKLKEDMLGFIGGILGNIDKSKSADYILGCPLFELGFDSADLLDFQEKIQVSYNIQLKPLFFFEYNTASKVIEYLESIRGNNQSLLSQEQPGISTIDGGGLPTSDEKNKPPFTDGQIEPLARAK